MPNISIVRFRELLEAERQLKDKLTSETLAWVGEALGKALALNLVTKPYSQWTEAERVLLRQVTGGATAARAGFIERLPKE
jgi:hypothetical protein